MVNTKESTSQEVKKEEATERAVVKEECSAKASKDLKNTTYLQERLQTLESKIKVVRSDVKEQVDGLKAPYGTFKSTFKNRFTEN